MITVTPCSPIKVTTCSPPARPRSFLAIEKLWNLSDSIWGKLEFYGKHGLLFAFPSSNHFGMKSTLEKKSNCHWQQTLKLQLEVVNWQSGDKEGVVRGGRRNFWSEAGGGKQLPSWPTSAALKARGEATKTQQKLVEFSRAANKYFHKKASWRSALGLSLSLGKGHWLKESKSSPI